MDAQVRPRPRAASLFGMSVATGSGGDQLSRIRSDAVFSQRVAPGGSTGGEVLYYLLLETGDFFVILEDDTGAILLEV